MPSTPSAVETGAAAGSSLRTSWPDDSAYSCQPLRTRTTRRPIIRVARLDDLRHRVADHDIAWLDPFRIQLAPLHHVAIVGIEREPDRARQKLPGAGRRNGRGIRAEIARRRQALRRALEGDAVIAIGNRVISELAEHVFRGGNPELARRLDEDVRRDAILHDQGETLATQPHAEATTIHLRPSAFA